MKGGDYIDMPKKRLLSEQPFDKTEWEALTGGCFTREKRNEMMKGVTLQSTETLSKLFQNYTVSKNAHCWEITEYEAEFDPLTQQFIKTRKYLWNMPSKNVFELWLTVKTYETYYKRVAGGEYMAVGGGFMNFYQIKQLY